MKAWRDTPAAIGRTIRQFNTHLLMKARCSVSSASRVLLLGATMLCTTTLAAQPGAADPNRQSTQPAPSISVGAATCANCHKEVVKGFANDPHSSSRLVARGKDVTCESCHGPSNAHAKSGDATLIFSPSAATAKEVNEKCQACHRSQHANFEHSAHGRGNVSCIGCHSIHAPGAAKHLLKLEQPQLCFQCHNEVKPEFSMPFHHRVEESVIDCTDCHDAHGSVEENTLRASTWQFIMCTKCHAPTAVPFVYEHPAIKAAGCAFCHFSHGGPNHKLLIQADVNKICLQCHLPSPNPTNGRPAVPEHAQSEQSPSCISCHASIHGSNTSDVFLKPARGSSEH
ncbi:MAG: DmsE family decaheme c-type cytochrome [Terracidiphilus sp.]|jgi:DmsE family decaheme c-type cytochrome